MYENKFTIKIDCKDTVGLVHSITKTLAEKNINIVSLQEHVDADDRHFFARLICDPLQTNINLEELEKEFCKHFTRSIMDNADITFYTHRKKKIIVMATKEYHCLGELLLRTKYDTLNAEILAVIASREGDVKHLCEIMDVPFFYVPVKDEESRESHEARIMDIITTFNPEYIVLARYMRILSAHFTQYYTNKIINIHHSFLPAFIGANPYRQAHERGVKIIGATAHFVTENLDEGPIISQQVKSVSHSHSVRDLQREGRDVEKLTLIDALEKVFSDRVFVHGNKTIVF